MSILGNEDIVLDPHAANAVVSLQDFTVNKLGVGDVAEEVSLDEGAAEVANNYASVTCLP
jgi:hypothetical protein